MVIWRTSTCYSHKGISCLGRRSWFCKLKKSFYGLKHAPRKWYLKFDKFMVSSDFTRLEIDYCCYFKWFENSYIIVLLYTDDMLVAGSSMKKIVNLKASLVKEFSMKDFGPARKILEMRISREKRGCWNYYRPSTWRRCWRGLTWQMLSLWLFHSDVTVSLKAHHFSFDDD